MHVEELWIDLCHGSTSEVTCSKCTSWVSFFCNLCDGFMMMLRMDEISYHDIKIN